MSEISFYHLTKSDIGAALPKLMYKLVSGGHRAVLMAGSEESLAVTDAMLWTKGRDVFIPHGTANDSSPEKQPIYLSLIEENPNNANMLVMLDGVEPQFAKSFERCLDIFDGRDEAQVKSARTRWKKYQDSGCEMTYWKQDKGGKWEKAA